MPKWLPRSNQRNANASQRPYGWRVFWSYLPDWVLTIFLWGIFYLIDKIDGYRRLFSVTDESLAHPFAEHERIPVWLLAVTCGIAPALIIVVVGAFHRSLWDIHTGLLGLVLSLGLGVTFTDIVKITVGRPRPDLFSRCQLPAGLTSNPTHGLTSWTVCTQTDKLQDGFRSFPSGHSSFGWTGMWYLELYLMAKLRVGNQRGHTYKSWILLIPVSASTLVSISRTMDYRHHAADVIVGAIIGVIAAWWGYRQYYPPIVARKSWQPYVPRVPRDDNLPLHSASAREHDRDGLLRTSLSPTSERRDDGYPPRQYAGGTTAMGMTPIGAGTGTGTGVGMAGAAGATENGVPMGYARDGPAYPGAAHTHNAPVATNV